MMGSTVTPLKRQRSVKFHIDENSAKPSIKITVSSDALAETILKNNVSSASATVVEDDEASCDTAGTNQPALIQIVGNCCATSSEDDGTRNPPSNGVLCNCANGDDKRTRIALDDFTVLEFPNCIDFGIKDFLCCKDEIELDLSSDTDASYLDATPPHRFSDSELDNQIEAMSITLDTQLNPFPSNGFILKSSLETDDDEEEETTEESFIMDEEEASSSASNSAATICGTGEGNRTTNMEHDDRLSVSSELLIQGELQNTLLNEDTPQPISAPNDQSFVAQATGDEIDLTPVQKGSLKVNSKKDGFDVEKIAEKVVLSGIQCQSEGLTRENSHEETFENEFQADNGTNQSAQQKGNNGVIMQRETVQKPQPISRKILQHPSKHFKRQISLPASIFMSYLLEQNNKANYGKQPSSDAAMNHQNEEQLSKSQHNCDIIVKNKLNRSNSCNKKSANPCNSIMRSSLSKIDSYRSTKVIHGSTEDYEYDDINISDTCNPIKNEYSGQIEISNENLSNDNDDDRDNSPSLNCTPDQTGWAWESKSDSFTESDDPHDADFDDEQQAFTSEVEKRSLILRHVRRLVRQDTTGNFAPPDFSI